MSLSRRGWTSRVPLPLALVASLALLAPGAALAAAKFGAKLRNPDGSVIQPTAPKGGFSCKDADPSLGTGQCTRVAVSFDKGSPGNHAKAPKNGVIKKINVVASGPGKFRLFMARVRGGNKAKVRKRGPSLSYQGDSTAPYTIEHLPLHLRVKRGDYLSIQARRTSMLSCTSGSVRNLLFEPPLVVGDPLRKADGTGTCSLLIQAVYRKRHHRRGRAPAL
jgi:hypothetical protein